MDELTTAMNRAAEAAVPLARDMLVGAVKGMNVQDAKNILAGGETSVTQFFAEYCPLIEKATGVRCEELRPDVEWAVLRSPKAAA